MVTVWGLAAGHGTTKAAARGAFTFRDLPKPRRGNARLGRR